MIIGVSGLGNTGSFAVIDLLKEYTETYYNPAMHEFSICYCPDGLLDLRYHLIEAPFRFQSSDIALLRFEKLINNLFRTSDRSHQGKYNKRLLKISHEYLEKITQIKWDGTWGFRYDMYSPFKKLLYKILFKTKGIFGKKAFINFAKETMRYSVRPENFDKITKEYINSLIDVVQEDKNSIFVLDQAFPGDNPEKVFFLFDDPRAIVVDRDPRDLYLLSKCDIREDSMWIPTDDVRDFINYYRLMRERRDAVKNPSKILFVQYEDLIYNYDREVKRIEEFLNISNHCFANNFFVKDVSINNTQLFNKHTNFREDIALIEKELSEYLYDYSKYEKKTVFGKTW